MTNSNHLHFRRCHACGEVSCVEGSDVKLCVHCHKLLAPFFFFQQSVNEGYSEITDKDILVDIRIQKKQNSENKFYYQPLKGLTVIW